MSPMIAYHVTRHACREAILRDGLLCDRPNKGQPFGVYVFREDGSLDHPGRNSKCFWTSERSQDVWEVAYIGPMIADQYVLNGYVLLRPATMVTLVTGSE